MADEKLEQMMECPEDFFWGRAVGGGDQILMHLIADTPPHNLQALCDRQCRREGSTGWRGNLCPACLKVLASFRPIEQGRRQHFTWVDGTPGHEQTYHFDVTAMLAFVAELPAHGYKGYVERVRFQITEQIKRNFAASVALDPVKRAALTPEDLQRPILGVQFAHGGTTFVDGNHRLAEWIRLGLEDGLMWLFFLGSWEKFLFDPGPELSDAWAEDTRRDAGRGHGA